VAGLQDWDGIFFFQYQDDGWGAGGWNADKIQRFFSFNGQPAKLALLAAFAPAFRRGDISPLSETAAGTFEEKLPPTLGLTARIGIDPKADKPAALLTPATGRRFATPDGQVVWDASDPARAHVLLNTPATRAVWGLIGGRQFDLGGVKFSVGTVERDYGVVVLTSLDGAPIESTRHALLAAVGSAQNSGMKWNDSRTSVGDRWGPGPALVNVVPVDMALTRGGARVFALDGRGQRVDEIKSGDRTGGNRFTLGTGYPSIWYEIEWAN
jgi:hypothetical protein